MEFSFSCLYLFSSLTCFRQTQRDAARRHLGYCPQFDARDPGPHGGMAGLCQEIHRLHVVSCSKAIPDKLTVRETIQLFARIRGLVNDNCMVENAWLFSRLVEVGLEGPMWSAWQTL